MDSSNNLVTGKLYPTLIKFTIPFLLSSLLQSLYGTVDLLVIGNFSSSADVSAVSTGSQVMTLVTFFMLGLTTGATILIGQFLGAKDEKSVSRVIGNSILVFGVLAIVCMLLMIFIHPAVLTWLNTPEEAMARARVYTIICCLGIPLIIGYNTVCAILRGMGDSKSPLAFVAIACVVNIAGDLILVAGFHMDVAGAAIATIAAQAISVLMSLIIMVKRGLPFAITKQDFCFSGEVRTFVLAGAPLSLQEFLTSISFLALCAFINRLGLDASSGYGVAQKIQSFILLLPSSLMQSMTPIVAQNVGAGREDRARSAMKWGMAFGASIGVFVAIAVFFKGDILSMLFSDDAAVIARSFEYLRGFALEAVVTSVLFTFMGYFNGHAKTLFVMAQGLAQSFLVRLPISYVMSIQPDASLTAIGFAAPAATVFGIVICFIYYKRMKRELIYRNLL